MKALLYVHIYFLSASFLCNAQQEAANWVLSPNSLLHFNSNNQTSIFNTPLSDFHESSSCISDGLGSLLFFTDGDTIKRADNSIPIGGEDISSLSPFTIRSGTQGSMILPVPNSDTSYYVMSLAMRTEDYYGLMSYSEIVHSNNSIQVVNSQQDLFQDTLSEKMAATYHCNGHDIWVVVIKYSISSFSSPNGGGPTEYNIEFNSFLLTENGFNPSPVKSSLNVSCPLIGQMKFSNSGNEIAYASNDRISIFSFDNYSGRIELQEEILLPLDNGYGLEFSPNDNFIYINEKQYNRSTGILTSLLNYNCPSQLQRGIDGKIYMNVYPENEVSVGGDNTLMFANYISFMGNADQIRQIGAITYPDTPGVGCQLVPDAIEIYSPNLIKNHYELPYFPSLYFRDTTAIFDYSGDCILDEYEFFLESYENVDSVNWLIENYSITTDTASYQFTNSGTYTVTYTAYVNGTEYVGSHCVDVCGSDFVGFLPDEITLCEGEKLYVNRLNPCANSYTWNTGQTTSGIWITQPGQYTLESISNCGNIVESITVVLDHDCGGLLKIPNVITANQDGTNDDFLIQVKGVKELSVSILNRWGNVIASKAMVLPQNMHNIWSTVNTWDGRNPSNTIVMDGVYFYRIDYVTLNNKRMSKSGFVQVIQ